MSIIIYAKLPLKEEQQKEFRVDQKYVGDSAAQIQYNSMGHH